LSLVLNSTDGLTSPVDGGRVGSQAGDSGVLRLDFTSETEVDSGEFFVGKISELVDTDSIGSGRGIVGFNDGFVRSEDVESSFFFSTTVRLVVEVLPGLEFSVDGVSGGHHDVGLDGLVLLVVVDTNSSKGSESGDKGKLNEHY